MGSVLDAVTDWSTVTIENPPIVYTRSEDFTVSGNPRPGLKEIWELSMKSMIALDLQTRKLLMPVIDDRMAKMKFKAEYKQDKEISALLKNNPEWNEQQLFELHDLFQIFETEGDGVVDVNHLIMGLANFDDKTLMPSRIDIIRQYSLGLGQLRFEDFLKMIEMLQRPENVENPLRHTFDNVLETIRILRNMSTPQQLVSGFL